MYLIQILVVVIRLLTSYLLMLTGDVVIGSDGFSNNSKGFVLGLSQLVDFVGNSKQRLLKSFHSAFESCIIMVQIEIRI